MMKGKSGFDFEDRLIDFAVRIIRTGGATKGTQGGGNRGLSEKAEETAKTLRATSA